MISIHDTVAVDELGRQSGIDRHHLKRLRNAFYKRHADQETCLLELPEEQRSILSGNVVFSSLQLHCRSDSQVDGASKLIFRTSQGHLLEAVILRIASGRTALCVSTQVGCAARCGFCATGTMGLTQNLSAGEILDQVIQANRLLALLPSPLRGRGVGGEGAGEAATPHSRPLSPKGRGEQGAVRNVVFMGMGEPFHNEEAVHRAIEVLCSPLCFALAPRRILISTVGIPEAMVRFARRFPQVRLALSLHSARQEVRERLIPLARRYRLSELRDATAAVVNIQQQQVMTAHPVAELARVPPGSLATSATVMIEYLLLKNLNDTVEDIEALAQWLTGLAVHVNLIPYNPVDGAPGLEGTETVGRLAFAAALRARGFKVTVRHSLGKDIAAACGQLVQVEQRRLARIAVE